MAPAGDPVATGLISSLARPGGNITGVSATAAELSSKNLELVQDILPAARNIAVLHNPNDPFARVRLDQLQQGAKGLRLDIRPVTVRSNDEMSFAFASMARDRAPPPPRPPPLLRGQTRSSCREASRRTR